MYLDSVQLTFFSKETIDRPDLLMRDINSELDNLLDDMPCILKIDKNIPFDGPIVSVQSSDAIYDLKIYRKRADFLIYPKEKDNEPLKILETYHPQIKRCYDVVFKQKKLIRVGLVITIFDANKNNTRTLYEKHINPSYKTNCTEFFSRTNELQNRNCLTFNDVKTIEAGERKVNNSICKGIFINFDVNTVINDSNKISASTIKDMLQMMQSKLEKIEI